jgi:hypothetical protein
MNELEILLYGLGIYLSTCLIWLIVTYIYCHTHYNKFTIKEMIGLGDVCNSSDNAAVFFFPFYNTFALLFTGVIGFCCFISYLFEKIGSIKLK